MPEMHVRSNVGLAPQGSGFVGENPQHDGQLGTWSPIGVGDSCQLHRRRLSEGFDQCGPSMHRSTRTSFEAQVDDASQVNHLQLIGDTGITSLRVQEETVQIMAGTRFTAHRRNERLDIPVTVRWPHRMKARAQTGTDGRVNRDVKNPEGLGAIGGFAVAHLQETPMEMVVETLSSTYGESS
ncbi:MAG: hypothetical protein R2733_24135 [Acidimicrobiales bacterium]